MAATDKHPPAEWPPPSASSSVTAAPPSASPVTRRVVFFYALGHILNDCCAACWFSYLLLYLSSAEGLSGTDAGLVLFSGQVADAVATPIVGLLSDASRGLPWLGLGRRKAWYLYGTLCVLISFTFVMGLCVVCAFTTSMSAKTAVFAVAAVRAGAGWGCAPPLVIKLTPPSPPHPLTQPPRPCLT